MCPICFSTDFFNETDISQELIIHLWKKFSKFDEKKASFRTWANKVMINKLRDRYDLSKKDMVEDKNGNLVRAEIPATEYLENWISKDESEEDVQNVFEEIIASDEGKWVKQINSDIDLNLAIKRATNNNEDRTFLQLKCDGYSFQEIGDGTDHRTGKKIRAGKKISRETIRKRLRKIGEKIKENNMIILKFSLILNLILVGFAVFMINAVLRLADLI